MSVLRRGPRLAPAALAPLDRADRRIANTTVHVSGITGLFLAAGMLATALVGWRYDDPAAGDLLAAGLIVGVTNVVLWRGTRPAAATSRTAAFAVVGFSWVYAALVATLPYVLAGTFDSYVYALFESVSGLTTTGSTVMADIESHGKGLLLYRQYTQWIGGGGIVLLAVAILQGFGVGGLELAGAETSATSERLAPRVATTARRLWTVYIVLTVAVTLGLVAVGVGVYDAVAHSMTMISTGGFSPYNDSISHFDSAAVEAVVIVGMLAGATSFALHFRAFTTRDARRYTDSPEFRTYMTLFGGGVVAVALINLTDGMSALTALREGAFNVATTLTGTGFGTSDFASWLPSAQLLLLMFMFIGGMTGSTTGAIKVLRFRVVLSHLWRDVRQARQPRGVYWVRLGRKAVAEDTVARIGAFVTLYLVAILTGTLLLTLFGEDLITAVSGVVTDIGLVGPALGDAGPHSNFLVYSKPSLGVLTFLMFLGRMELYVALLMFVAPIGAVRRAGSGRPPRRQSVLPPAAVAAAPLASRLGQRERPAEED